jgi:ribose transport system permease protein
MIRKLSEYTNLGLLVVTVVLFLVMSIVYSHFFTLYNLEVIAMGFVQEAIMALGMTMVIISGGIDLSVGSILVFSSILVGLFLKAKWGIAVSIILTLGISGFIGFANAVMINRLRAHPFIVTLGTMTAVRGFALVLTGGHPVTGFPKGFFYFGQGYLFNFPFPVVLFVFLAIVFHVLLRRNQYFSQAYFIGSNPDAARLCGMNVERFRWVTYTISAILAGTAGIITASQYISANSSFGLDAELRVITAVIIGGASLSGGVGTIGRTVLGVIFLAIVANALVQAGVPTYWEKIAYGAMLVLSVMLERYFRYKRTGVEDVWKDFMLGGDDK